MFPMPRLCCSAYPVHLFLIHRVYMLMMRIFIHRSACFKHDVCVLFLIPRREIGKYLNINKTGFERAPFVGLSGTRLRNLMAVPTMVLLYKAVECRFVVLRLARSVLVKP
jgi:hypothetical protein